MQQPVTVVILAAGLGTRMKSKKAKVLHKAGGMTLLEHVAHAAGSIAAPADTIAVIGHQADQVRETVSHTGIRFVTQAEQKGTGHALSMCREAISDRPGRVVVLYGDCPLLTPETLKRLIEKHDPSEAAATVITTVLDDPTGYGRIITDEGGYVLQIVEQKAARPEHLAIREINSGIYSFRADLLWKYLGDIKTNNPAGEFYLTDIVEILRQAGHNVTSLRVSDPAEILGINNRLELAQADRILRERKIRELLLSGVTIEKPETVSVDAQAMVGADTVIGPFTQILGRTVIGEDCVIGACSIVSDSTLANNVEIGPFTIVNTSRVGADAHIGPFARLRLENDVAPGAQIGNFVELKKTKFGEESKAMHLSYLGDATIADGVNVGAGTITCNYDGVRKHQTRIGSGAFVGSNSTLVAPVEIGEGSYVAAGSVITEPAPANALVLGRARQVTKEGWAKKRREQTAVEPISAEAPSAGAGR